MAPNPGRAHHKMATYYIHNVGIVNNYSDQRKQEVKTIELIYSEIMKIPLSEQQQEQIRQVIQAMIEKIQSHETCEQDINEYAEMK